MLLNLLSHGVKFSEAGGSVTVTAEQSDDARIMLQVADTGIGVAPEEIPGALAAFGQIDTRLARRYEGTGLGLPLVKAIVELHGGELRIAHGSWSRSPEAQNPFNFTISAKAGARGGGTTLCPGFPIPAVTLGGYRPLSAGLAISFMLWFAPQGARLDLIPTPAIVRRNGFGG